MVVVVATVVFCIVFRFLLLFIILLLSVCLYNQKDCFLIHVRFNVTFLSRYFLLLLFFWFSIRDIRILKSPKIVYLFVITRFFHC